VEVFYGDRGGCLDPILDQQLALSSKRLINGSDKHQVGECMSLVGFDQ
jgi:hypothetical protein